MKKFINLIFTMLAMCSMGVQGQEKTEMVYPQAEWSKAGDILMYTPGQELFSGGYGAAHCMTQVLQREAYKPGEDPTGVRGVNARAAEAQSAYRLNGMVANENDRGIIIQNGKKSIRKE